MLVRALLVRALWPALVLTGCLDFQIEPGTLRCERSVSPPCPNDWVCVGATPEAESGRCFPAGTSSNGDAAPPPADGDASPVTPDGDAGPPPGDGTVAPGDPLAVGPAAAPEPSVPGKRFHVAPGRGNMANPGTEQEPWSTLAEVLAAKKVEKRDSSGAVESAGVVKPGDALILHDGDHGDIALNGYFNGEAIHVLAAAGQRPRLRRVELQNGSHWRFQGLTVVGPCGADGELFRVQKADHVDLVGNTLSLEADHSKWTKADWEATPCSGIAVLDGVGVRLAFNEIRTVSNGIFLSNTVGNLVERNLIDGFTDKGMMISNVKTRDVVVRANLVQNGYDVGRSSTLIHVNTCTGCKGLSFSGNRLFARVGEVVPAALRKWHQGIMLLDGPYEDVSIVNNVVIGDHWNGVVVLEGTDVRIVNNTAVGGYDATGDDPTFTEIRVTSSAPATVLVRNNLTNKVDAPGAAQVDNNGLVDKPDDYFVDWRAADYRLGASSPAIDKGFKQGAPADDLAGRPRDEKPDQGAFERVASDPS